MAHEKWKKRFQIERSIRNYFYALQYEEVKTPLLVMSPGLEPHIKPIAISRGPGLTPSFLPTSPEFAMKKLLAMGLPRIFQICSSFRDEPRSREHHPEFTMLEFYEAHLPLNQLMERVSGLIRALCFDLHQKHEFIFKGRTITLPEKFSSITVADAFQKHLGINLRHHETSEGLFQVCKQFNIMAEIDEPWDDLYFKLWLNLIEPKLPTNEPIFVTHYPLSQSSLCNQVLDETGYSWANRFELYLGGLELGNAFDELRDPKKQRENFLKDQKIRRDTYGDAYPESPIDESFLAAIRDMPPVSGIAMGVDRICMLLLDAESIDEVIPLPSFWR